MGEGKVKLFAFAPILFLLTFMGISEVVAPAREYQPRNTYEGSGAAPSPTAYQFPMITTPAPTPTVEPTATPLVTPTAIPEVWQFVGQGIATYYAAGWNCFESIINNQIRYGNLPQDFQRRSDCFYCATVDRNLMGRTFKVINLKDGIEITVTQVDAVASNDRWAFENRGRVIDLSYAAAQAIGPNSYVEVWLQK